MSGETISDKTTNKSDQARVDISARGFWLTGQGAFFDVRVFNPTAKRYVNQELRKSYEINEKGKKKQYNELILQVEHGTFTSLVIEPGVVACTCNPATLQAEFWNSVGSIPVGGKQSFDWWVDSVTTCNPALGEEPD